MHNASLSCLALRVALRDVWNCKRFKKKKYYNVVNYCKLKLIKNYFWELFLLYIYFIFFILFYIYFTHSSV